MGPNGEVKGGGFVFFFDLRRAFSSGNRERLFFDLIAKFPGEKFIHKLRNC